MPAVMAACSIHLLVAQNVFPSFLGCLLLLSACPFGSRFEAIDICLPARMHDQRVLFAWPQCGRSGWSNIEPS
jgi:hypothetical protein